MMHRDTKRQGHQVFFKADGRSVSVHTIVLRNVAPSKYRAKAVTPNWKYNSSLKRQPYKTTMVLDFRDGLECAQYQVCSDSIKT